MSDLSAILRRVDRVVVLGADAARDLVARGDVGVSDDDTARTVITWITDEPSGRGIDGLERMRLIRDDIDRRVHDLLAEFTAERADPSPR